MKGSNELGSTFGSPRKPRIVFGSSNGDTALAASGKMLHPTVSSSGDQELQIATETSMTADVLRVPKIFQTTSAMEKFVALLESNDKGVAMMSKAGSKRREASGIGFETLYEKAFVVGKRDEALVSPGQNAKRRSHESEMQAEVDTHLLAVVEDPQVIRIIGKCFLDRGYGSRNVMLGERRDCDGHVITSRWQPIRLLSQGDDDDRSGVCLWNVTRDAAGG
ncbi:hypothetical protein BP6252_00752 [Coleophoma cylindrospora]|uniref:Uncharacterized protein n=1 Tax=Coleophoma cylindrospora TaxID=1849047 RepID=A0A3D8SQX6_9HELO|nr:hypothetical protein BP6252_00752 [Coleophoma cylindrospora]